MLKAQSHMVKSTLNYTCTNCHTTHKKWAGKCESYGEWNSIKEEAPLASGPKGKTLGANKGRKIILGDLTVNFDIDFYYFHQRAQLSNHILFYL